MILVSIHKSVFIFLLNYLCAGINHDDWYFEHAEICVGKKTSEYDWTHVVNLETIGLHWSGWKATGCAYLKGNFIVMGFCVVC